MEAISKPELVNFLRYLDHNRLLFPRIRYASIRSKNDLLVDLRNQFYVKEIGTKLYFHNRKQRAFPLLFYDLSTRQFSVDIVEKPAKPKFSIVRKPVTIHFE